MVDADYGVLGMTMYPMHPEYMIPYHSPADVAVWPLDMTDKYARNMHGFNYGISRVCRYVPVEVVSDFYSRVSGQVFGAGVNDFYLCIALVNKDCMSVTMYTSSMVMAQIVEAIVWKEIERAALLIRQHMDMKEIEEGW